MNKIAFANLATLAHGLAAGEFTSVELTQLYLDRIASFNGKAHAYVAVYGESALLQAQAADLHRRSGLPLPPLHGLPIAVKDVCEIEGRITTAGSAAWKDRRSKVTSTVVDRLQAAGMVLLGKVHTAEFAFSGWGLNPPMGTPRNPWDWNVHHRAPGGSSSGSAVAVAAGLAPVAIGSDTGGSVRIPAAFNGLTGLKTSYGLISTYGTIPLSSSLDSIGPLARTAEDAALVTDALLGFDPRDPLTCNRPQYTIDLAMGVPLKGRRVAVMAPEQYPWPVSEDVLATTMEAVRVLRSLGAVTEHVSVPLDFPEMTLNNGNIIASEIYHYHAAYIEDPALPFGHTLRERVLKGKHVTADMYLSILEHRRRAIATFFEWIRPYDMLLTPTVPFVACPLEEIDESRPGPMSFTRAFNYLDTSAISMPAGFSHEGLPIGVQLVALPWQENMLLRAAHEYQQATDWHIRTPVGLL